MILTKLGQTINDIWMMAVAVNKKNLKVQLSYNQTKR